MIIGVDYSTKAIDLAQHHEGGWRHTKLLVNGFGVEFLQQLTVLLAAYAQWGGPTEERIVYVEQPWMRTNAATSMLMVKVATAVEVTAKLAGYRVEWAHVTSWRSKVFGKGKYSKIDAKRLSKEWAQENTGLDIGKDDNAADACCIARYGELKEAE